MILLNYDDYFQRCGGRCCCCYLLPLLLLSFVAVDAMAAVAPVAV
jgi:hypothetical protein